MTRLLLLGGTIEARILTQNLCKCHGLDVFYSLAGRTSASVDACFNMNVRRGGFGGITGLECFLRDNNIDLLLDATHPHATKISSNAAVAAQLCDIPRAQLHREPWKVQTGDNWQQFNSLKEIAATLPLVARVFVSIGSQGLKVFAARKDVFFLARSIEAPRFPDGLTFRQHFPSGELLLERGPFVFEDELALLQKWEIEFLVSKNSGGDATRAKIDAARELRIPVRMLASPPPVPGTRVKNINEAFAWVLEQLC